MSGPQARAVAVVTGANSGIGKEIARGLAARGATVVLACRNLEKGAAARDEIAKATANERVSVMRVDLADYDSVRAFTDAFRSRFDRLDVLVNNAGFYTTTRVENAEGHESTFAANHLGHFLLTNRLLDVLVRSAPARTVNLSSEAHRFGGGMRFHDLMTEKPWWGWFAYSQAKLANVMFTRELARRLEGTGVTANAAHPGVVRSGFGRREGGLLVGAGVRVLAPVLLSAAKGADTPLWLATSPEVAGMTGEYFIRRRAVRPSRAARDDTAARRLWDESARLVGL